MQILTSTAGALFVNVMRLKFRVWRVLSAHQEKESSEMLIMPLKLKSAKVAFFTSERKSVTVTFYRKFMIFD